MFKQSRIQYSIIQSVAALPFLAVLLTSGIRADVIYDVDSSYTFGSGYSALGGTITVSDSAAADGLLTSAEIVGFSINFISPTGSQSFSQVDGEIFSQNGDIGINATRIFVPDPGVFGINNLVLRNPTTLVGVQWASAETGGFIRRVSLVDASATPTLFQSGGKPSGFTIANVSAVPEPSMLMITGAAVAAPMLRRRRRSRKED